MKPLALLGLLLLAAPGSAGRPGTVHLFLWAEYISRDVLLAFEEETGIRVQETNFENEESMLAKVQQPGAHFDVVVASNEIVPAMIRQGLVGSLDRGKIPNLRHLEPRFVGPPYDPGGLRAVPYMWGTLGIAYDSDRVRLETPSWGALWDRRYKDRICMFDQITASVGVALQHRGLPVSSRDDGDLAKAREALLAQRELVHAYANDEYKGYLQAGKVWISMAWNGDAAKTRPSIRYAVPEEGSVIWVDNLCLLARPCDGAAAHAFLDYVMRPEVNARIAAEISYATCNAAAREHLPREMRENPVIYPDEETLRRCEFREDLGEDLRKYRKVWAAVKAGG